MTDVGAKAVHAGFDVADHLDPVPLCWEFEFRERFGAPTPVDEWELTVDVLWDMDKFPTTGELGTVTCLPCKELIHA